VRCIWPEINGRRGGTAWGLAFQRSRSHTPSGVGAGVPAITQPYTILMCASGFPSVRLMSHFDKYGLAAGHSTLCLSRNIGHPAPGPSFFAGPSIFKRPDTLANFGFAHQYSMTSGSLFTFHFWSKSLPQSTSFRLTRPAKLSSSFEAPAGIVVVFFFMNSLNSTWYFAAFIIYSDIVAISLQIPLLHNV